MHVFEYIIQIDPSVTVKQKDAVLACSISDTRTAVAA